MKENPYQVLGATVPSMLGRAALVGRIEGHLLKPSPDHVSVVGPVHYGKSVLLRHLADKHREGSPNYLTTVHVDLRRDTPTSDDAFKRRLAREVSTALQPLRQDLCDLLVFEDEGIHELLVLVLDDLAKSDARLLVVLDGFDYALAGAGLTRNLWDQLRSLAQKTSLRFVTGSRRPLRELCRTEESRTSDFWEIFYDTPIRVAALDDADWGPFLQPLLDAGRVVDDSARKEIANWTGGVPLLACALLHRLWDAYCDTARLSKPEIDRAAEAVLEEQHGHLAALWDDCDVELRSDLGALAASDIPAVDVSDSRRRVIVSRGFGRIAKNRLRGSCRLMQRYVETQAPALGELNRLFGTAPGFEANIRSMLELRLAQVAGREVDRDLREYVRKAVRDLQPDPMHALIWIRSISDRALALIWDAELPPDGTIPSDWFEKWRREGVEIRNVRDGGKLPHGSGPQCGVLRQATGTDRVPRLTTYATRTTSLLVDHLQSIGNFAQHRETYPETNVSMGFAAASVLAAISLVESLTADLHRKEGNDRNSP